LEDNKHRLREQVLVTIRSADIGDLTDASLGLIKRLILERARKTLGKPLLREVIISDYSFIEQ
jgi:flagellar FliL protein